MVGSEIRHLEVQVALDDHRPVRGIRARTADRRDPTVRDRLAKATPAVISIKSAYFLDTCMVP